MVVNYEEPTIGFGMVVDFIIKVFSLISFIVDSFQTLNHRFKVHCSNLNVFIFLLYSCFEVSKKGFIICDIICFSIGISIAFMGNLKHLVFASLSSVMVFKVVINLIFRNIFSFLVFIHNYKGYNYNNKKISKTSTIAEDRKII